MSTDEVDEVGRLREKLREVTEQFEREVRARGFDPQQAENVPLTRSLATLLLEQKQLSSRLTELTGEQEKS